MTHTLTGLETQLFPARADDSAESILQTLPAKVQLSD
jgi:hypothetical protein